MVKPYCEDCGKHRGSAINGRCCDAERKRQDEVWRFVCCFVCRLPLVKNNHPKAGTPELLNTIGAVNGCLPCAEKRANGRREVISNHRKWLQDLIADGVAFISPESALIRLNEADEERRVKYHDLSDQGE